MDSCVIMLMWYWMNSLILDLYWDERENIAAVISFQIELFLTYPLMFISIHFILTSRVVKQKFTGHERPYGLFDRNVSLTNQLPYVSEGNEKQQQRQTVRKTKSREGNREWKLVRSRVTAYSGSVCELLC